MLDPLSELTYNVQLLALCPKRPGEVIYQVIYLALIIEELLILVINMTDKGA